MANFGKISSLASIVNMFAGAEPTKAQIVPLDDDGSEIGDEARGFQYFPEQIQDSKGANYATKNIPGGSHPLYQFINGTDRTISFTAIFTSDEDPAPTDLLGVLRGGLNINLQQAAGTLTNALNISSDTTKKHTVPVESAIIWLRSFIYPRYSNKNTNNSNLSTVIAPPVARLYLPNSNIYGSTASGQLTLDSIDCLMTQCDVVYESFYRNGTQRITTVNLTFNETVQTGTANWQFVDGQKLNDAWVKGNSKIEAYPIKTKGSQTDVQTAKGLIDKAKNTFSNPVGSLF